MCFHRLHQSIKILSNNGILEINNQYDKKSTIQFIIHSQRILSYLESNKSIKKFTNSILRTYTGLFEEEVKIDEFLIAKKNGITKKQVVSNLDYLQKEGIIQYKGEKSNVELLFFYTFLSYSPFIDVIFFADIFLSIKNRKLTASNIFFIN